MRRGPASRLGKRNALESAIGLGLVIVGVVIVADSRSDYHGDRGSGTLGPGFFPTWTAVLVIVLALLLIAHNTVLREEPSAGGAADDVPEAPPPHRWRAIPTIGIACAYVGLIPTLGFGAASFLLVLLCMRLERAPWLQAVAIAAGCVALGVVARDYAFIELPTGLAGL
ncbi:MAG TPA: tripartite tricarboxylate transporter TctB family protein [Mycobacteriales bacterium]|nr:tripartite tricarboxylate transporter TctB family protein [Mycobacteriales bacterium]